MQRDVGVLIRPEHADAGVVDPDVDAAERLTASLRDALDRREIGDVGGDGDGAAAERFAFARERVQQPLAPRRQHQAGALAREGQRGGAADAAGGAGDDDAAARHRLRVELRAGAGEPFQRTAQAPRGVALERLAMREHDALRRKADEAGGRLSRGPPAQARDQPEIDGRPALRRGDAERVRDPLREQRQTL